ncbi:MAG: bifunctional diaminohydroxyphosphoribosylaminopyrimidine deaminase/5-amino-6-(5-phosphoribosylamino)uracil reductase RibD [Bacteroidaceae bacterium]|nr:bifunctional diaminohydroxyphosphoribosylaminopyrimidine deaminase/5-amino-6-(5-phosphoribosylamino)uracil reductase RibD [Bacteroidaceae bacterium]
MSSVDELYMQRCLQLARCAAGSTSPNPMVGAVIVCNGRVIGEGFHIRAGEPHAEVNAVNSVAERDKHLLGRSTMYVSLEPCSHYGKTPPCCDMIIARGIPRVVIGLADPNPQVNGAGIERMRAAGVDVEVGVLEAECSRLNRAFFTSQVHKRPYVTLKWAQSADGFIDLLRDGGQAVKISSSVSQVAVHRLRAQSDAILVGRHTALLDNPSLDIRHWVGRPPLRLVIDKTGSLPVDLNIFNGKLPTVVYTACEKEDKVGKNIEQIVLDFDKPLLPQILAHLSTRKVNSLLVEGGATLLQSFIDSSLWDEARVEINPSLELGCGVVAPSLGVLSPASRESISGNEILHFYR